MSLLADIQEAGLDWAHKLNHTGQGEQKKIYLLKRTAGTNALTEIVVAVESFEIKTSHIDGVDFELQIAESLLTAAQVKEGAAWKHGSQTYRVIQPAPFEPAGPNRTWRFSLSRAEKS